MQNFEPPETQPKKPLTREERQAVREETKQEMKVRPQTTERKEILKTAFGTLYKRKKKKTIEGNARLKL